MPFASLVLTVFQVACLAVGIVPNLALFCTMYNVIHKGPLCCFQVTSPHYNFLYTKKMDKVETSLVLLSYKYASGHCIMPHKVNYMSITTGKGVLARVSERKSTFAPEVCTAPKKSKKAPKVPVPEAAPYVSEVVIEGFGPPSSPSRDPVTIVIPDRVSPSLGEVPPSSSRSLPVLPSSESTSGSDGPFLPG
ncbi:hypothetical protein LIER_02088 [Lithospermum erythrorhizon]|uniref:Uncharacterized protein n=1 Tax=Lithospermum erythrorhizon TaxID=34254 RepID=A0AAV3NPP7_LITER